MSTSVQSIITHGTAGTIVDVECRLSNNLPIIVIVGSASRAVDESKERIRGAFATSRIMLPRKRITVNMAPADVPKADSGFDLAIAVAILRASQQLRAAWQRSAFIGELGLDGNTRAVRGIIGKLLAGRARGIDTFYIPAANLEQARLVPKIRLVPVDSLSQLYQHLTGTLPYELFDTGEGSHQGDNSGTSRTGDKSQIQLSDITGQSQAKRALEIAATGGHNIFFSGPPGTGKSMLARALAGLLPPLDREEVLEVTQLHSLTRPDYERLVSLRPFRAPHHSASLVAVTGGGARLRPGEISLAHRGVLFFDELPEFRREALEALRQPLEDRIISVSRAKDTAEYPANFIFVATANPCPCGYYGTGEACRCSAWQIHRYRNHISGPVLDRIDLYSNVHEIKHDKLLAQTPDAENDNVVRQRILHAREQQSERFGSANKLNSDMTNSDIRQFAHLEPAASTTLNSAARRMNLSARAYMRTVKVSRSIADLEGCSRVNETHVAEALAYRPRIKDG